MGVYDSAIGTLKGKPARFFAFTLAVAVTVHTEMYVQKDTVDSGSITYEFRDAKVWMNLARCTASPRDYGR
jgi:hypothetical protein